MAPWEQAPTRQGSGSAGIVVIAFALVVIATLGSGMLKAAPAVESVSEHALAKHGTDAELALEAIKEGAVQYHCPDGRERFVAPVKGKPDTWALVVMEGDRCVTAFTKGQGAIRGYLERDECWNEFTKSHPNEVPTGLKDDQK